MLQHDPIFGQDGLEVGEVVIAVTARDINSPLASFMAEADAPCLMIMTITPLEIVVRPGVRGQPGDVNADGQVTNLDAVLLQAVLDGALSSDSPLVETLSAADINGDGLVDTGDVLVIQGVQVGAVGRRQEDRR